MILPAGPVVPSGRTRRASKPHRRSTLECPPQRFPPQRPDSSRVLPPPPNLASFLPKAPLPAPPVPARPQRRSFIRQSRPPFPPGHHPARSDPVDHGLPTPPRTHPFQWPSDRRRARIRPPDPSPSHFRRGGTPMFGLSAAVRVYLATKPADMRKSFDGLSALASGSLATRSPQHPSGEADRRVAAGPLAGVAPGRHRRDRLEHMSPGFVDTPDERGASVGTAAAVCPAPRSARSRATSGRSLASSPTPESRRCPEHDPIPFNRFEEALYRADTLHLRPGRPG